MRRWWARRIRRLTGWVWLWAAHQWKCSAQRWLEQAAACDRQGRYVMAGMARRNAEDTALRAIRCVSKAREVDPSGTGAKVRA